MTFRVGIIGLSEGNGHPFSFSAIVNGFCGAGMRDSGWPVIHEYLRRRDPSEFGGLGMQVTHAWTQDPGTTDQLCRACIIPNAVQTPVAMLDHVDAVILARDDYTNHMALAKPFLEAGVPLLIDKPLTLDPTELAIFRPYLESGQLMSCSGMRFARELDEPRAQLDQYGSIRLIRGAILNDWAKYGIHLIDAVINLTPARPVAISALPARHESLAIEMDDGALFELDALGPVGRCFRLDLYGTARMSTHDIHDNFSMFRRLLFHFSQAVSTRRPAIPAADTLVAIRTLIAGQLALTQHRTVIVDEVAV